MTTYSKNELINLCKLLCGLFIIRVVNKNFKSLSFSLYLDANVLIRALIKYERTIFKFNKMLISLNLLFCFNTNLRYGSMKMNTGIPIRRIYLL